MVYECPICEKVYACEVSSKLPVRYCKTECVTNKCIYFIEYERVKHNLNVDNTRPCPECQRRMRNGEPHN